MKLRCGENQTGIRLAVVCVYFFCFAEIVTSQVRKTATPGLRTISIVTQPNATVWLDGVKYGKTPDDGKLTIATVAPGRRLLRIRADGFREVTKTILPSQKGNITVLLTRTTDEAELAYQQAEALSTSDRERAVAGYRHAIRLRPGYAEAYIGLARIYSEARNRDEAEKAIKEARKIKPRFAEASTIEGRNFKDGGDDDKAIASFMRAIREGGGFQPEANTGLGLLYKERAESDGASGEYEREKANYAEAAKYFAVAIKQLSGAPDAVVLYQFLGLVYEQQKKHKEAISVYEEFLRLFPGHSEAAAIESFIVQLKKQLSEPK
ncbi:MAG: tetratricopeptide repeat protein [Pyrinomonadaceae bacterium]